MIDFEGFRKIARLSREVIITEKIDGTNSQIYISEDLSPFTLESGRIVPFLCGSRTRWIFPENDNHGFAKWAYEHSEELLKLGKGHHFGEWWGQGINRNYGLKEKRFSLFNVSKWLDDSIRPSCCRTVPVLYKGMFDTQIIESCLEDLKIRGSVAVPSFMRPEGIVIYHTHANIYFKKTIENDECSKTEAYKKEQNNENL
jgi:hypothetical protein